ncbi:MAG: hypothetical protein HY268_08140 [Deltaproteobacteria bacterium]|nr:hypothetical protein [Deltaproteobacteria bacterium]
MKSQIFYTDRYKVIEASIADFLNSQPDFLSVRTATSPRAVGDAVQDLLCDNFQSMLGDICAEYSSTFARRAMADLAFTDTDGFYYVVDVKTHRISTSFNMPNLTSVERLSRFYEDDKNYFILLVVKYDILGTRATVQKVHFVPIEFLSWECLTIGALGWGQIQIANANIITLNEQCSRKSWMLQLCDVMLTFYPREIGKIHKRIGYFERLRQ